MIMSRSSALSLSGPAAVFLLFCAQAFCAAPEPSVSGAGPRRNVVWICVDALRSDHLGCYGYARPVSPGMDRLAGRGTVFEKNFSQCAYTWYSVPSFMTGRYFPTMCLGWACSQYRVLYAPPEHEKLFPEILRENGYETAMFTANLLFQVRDRMGRAFDTPVFAGFDRKRVKKSFAQMNELIFPWLEARRGAGKPFFAYIHAMDSHFPIFPEPPHDRWMDPEYDAGHLETTDIRSSYARRDGLPFTQADRAFFHGMYDAGVAYADEGVAALMAKLEELGLLDDTYVVLMADHGEVLGDDGVTFGHQGPLDIALHVPLIIAGPGIPAGRRVPGLSENTDIVPTLFDLLGIAPPPIRLDGRSLVPLMRGDPGAAGRGQVFSVPDRTWCDEPSVFVLREADRKYEWRPQEAVGRLWRLPEDPMARVNVADTEPETLARFDGLLRRDYLPLLEEFRSQPVRAYVYDAGALAAMAEETAPSSVEAVTFVPDIMSERYDSDNKWACANGVFWACNFNEDAPALALSMAVPAGAYQAFISIMSRAELRGHPSSSLRVGLQDAAARTITSAPPASGTAPRFELVDLGRVEVSDGTLRLLLAPGEKDHWAGLPPRFSGKG